MITLLLCLSIFSAAAFAAHVDLSSYPLSQELRDRYNLYWRFDMEAETISFAVRVRTTGWVGLGLSPTGGMTNADIVIGWVNDQGQGLLHDRFATGETRPSVDNQQDWTLDAEGWDEEDGYTVLAFSRDWVTCDDQDRDIKVETARVIFSWNDADPAGDDPMGVAYHGPLNRGSVSINLIGVDQELPAQPDDIQQLNINVTNVRQNLLTRQKIIEKKEKLRKLREQKKFGKKVQQDILQKRRDDKKASLLLDAIKHFRKGKGEKLSFLTANDGDDDFPVTAHQEARGVKGQKHVKKDK